MPTPELPACLLGPNFQNCEWQPVQDSELGCTCTSVPLRISFSAHLSQFSYSENTEQFFHTLADFLTTYRNKQTSFHKKKQQIRFSQDNFMGRKKQFNSHFIQT